MRKSPVPESSSLAWNPSSTPSYLCGPWASHFASLGLSFFLCKMGMTTAPSSFCCQEDSMI